MAAGSDSFRFIALYAAKGARLHRKSGMLFVRTIVVLSLTGAVMAAIRASAWSAANIPAGLLTAYLVMTALTAVRSFPSRAPAPLRIPALLPIPVLVPLAAMLYWLWRA